MTLKTEICERSQDMSKMTPKRASLNIFIKESHNGWIILFQLVSYVTFSTTTEALEGATLTPIRQTKRIKVSLSTAKGCHYLQTVFNKRSQNMSEMTPNGPSHDTFLRRSHIDSVEDGVHTLSFPSKCFYQQSSHDTIWEWSHSDSPKGVVFDIR